MKTFFERLETDDRITLADDMTTMLDREKENSDLEKATKGKQSFFIH